MIDLNFLLKLFSIFQNHLEGYLHRPSQSFPDTIELYSEDIRETIDKSINKVNQILKSYHHPEIPLDHYEFYNNKSDNFQRIMCQKNETERSCDIRVDQLNIDR